MSATATPFFRSLARWSDQQPPHHLHPSLHGLTSPSLSLLQKLLLLPVQPDPFPRKRRAAVMVGLFASRHGHLNVLLTRRSKTMRTYAGETALPGGKMEPQDLTLEHTARREAHEECGITLNRHKVRKLATLSPFLSRGNLIVTPVVFFITDQTLMPRLNAKEVDVLFSHPLENFLTGPISRSYEIPWFSTKVPYRLFEFPSKHSPIIGFTADILIEVAVIGYGREPDFERKAAGQLAMSEIITIALQEAPEFQSDDQALGVAKHDLLEDGSPRGTLCSRFVDALQPPQMSISQTLSSLGKRFLGKRELVHLDLRAHSKFNPALPLGDLVVPGA
ncbi:hypothetical protein PCANC_12139 [Puccinia coronata f. sp. avenae]|uniref:Nudix hydrolase domain-containing protein n=1 Tax=Puccinia coronata f. sp. avenae TaxID=200324 RepID=A0A2N5VNZ6_9BASI|nr:hypothetical protein PCASD_16508 [Puccinia coronata f. sp. avenae]PLW49069.1 hypothetical protein PCANC_12139 [Puccinia coronata f. sp. avenae]PLW51725.1 hypothetical protein PCASD_00569 [Puccinia coronata f. sp. avenae]